MTELTLRQMAVVERREVGGPAALFFPYYEPQKQIPM